jgi:hypothetical protein
MPSTVDPEEFMGSKIKFTPDQIEEKLMKIGQKYGWDSIDPGHGQGYDELYFDTSAEYTSATQRQLAVNIVKTVNEIDKFFNDINRSLQATGLPGYKVNVWQGMGENGNINQHEDLSHITNIAKGQTAKPDAGPAIGKMILKHLPSYEAGNDELGYDPQAFTMAKAIANTYITQGERAGLKAQVTKIAGNLSVSHMIDELLSDAGASGLRTIWTLDEQGVAEGSDLDTMRKAAGLPVSEGRILDEGGETLGHIMDRFKHEVDQFEKGGDLDNDLYYALFDYYSDHGEIPYGIAKGRDGDPFEWVTDRLDQELGTGNYAPRVSEADALATFEVMSGFDAPVAEGSCNMTAEGEYCPEHALAECGGGMHEMGTVAGSMAPVMGESQDSDALLARIKSLALIR